MGCWLSNGKGAGCGDRPLPLVQAPRRHGDGLLDFPHHEDARQHVFLLLPADWLRRVPDWAVGRHHGFRGQVERVIAPLYTLRAEREGALLKKEKHTQNLQLNLVLKSQIQFQSIISHV